MLKEVIAAALRDFARPRKHFRVGSAEDQLRGAEGSAGVCKFRVFFVLR